MSIIKSAILYKATIPTDKETLQNHLSTEAFQPPLLIQSGTSGFVTPPGAEAGCGLVATFHQGLAFAVRVDEKILPASVIADRLAIEIEAVKQATGRKTVGKQMRRELKDKVTVELLSVALVRTKAVITCFYDTESGNLLINTTSQKLADLCTSLLVKAVGSVKTETIHVSGVKHGLTTRLKHWLNVETGEYSEAPEGEQIGFGEFTPSANVALAGSGEDRRKMSVSVGDLMINREGILEAIQRGFGVTSLGLQHKGLSFRLTDNFHFKGIVHPLSDDPDDESTWEAMAAIELIGMRDAIAAMVEMFSYAEPAKEGEDGKEGGSE